MVGIRIPTVLIGVKFDGQAIRDAGSDIIIGVITAVTDGSAISPVKPIAPKGVVGTF